MGDIIDYCSECGRALGIGEAWQKGGLEFCIICKDIVGARIP